MKIILSIILIAICNLVTSAETFVVCVGISNYADPKISNLSKPEQDAKVMAEFYKKGTDNIITITGKYATGAQIIRSLRDQFSRATAGDKIVFYFSGHGYRGGLCPYDMRHDGIGIPYVEIINAMTDSKATDKFIFADACNSGAFRQDNVVQQLQPGNIFMFLSSRDNESSMESPFLANGYFTKYLLRGLRGGADKNGDRKITASELFKYVSSGVREQTGNRQHPVMWGKFQDNFIIVQYSKK